MLKVNERHPKYIFDEVVKKAKYGAILKAYGGKRVKLACTFPGLSNYRFERQLIEMYPDIRIDCFEDNRVTYDEILKSFHKPSQVTLRHSKAEEYLASRDMKYDIIFFDYCGGAHEDISGLIDLHMTDGGVFAITEFTARGARDKHIPFEHENFQQVIELLRYGNSMEFKAYKKAGYIDERIVVDVPDVIATTSNGSRIYVQSKSNFPRRLKVDSESRPTVLVNDLSALRGYFDEAMIELIDSVLVVGNFKLASADMNRRRRNYFMKYPYTPQKVKECWESIGSKLVTFA